MTRIASLHLKRAAAVALYFGLATGICNCVTLESGTAYPPQKAADGGPEPHTASPDATADSTRDAADSDTATDAAVEASTANDAEAMTRTPPKNQAPASARDAGTSRAAADEDAGESEGRSMICPDHTTSQCSGGVWPGGTINYAFRAEFSARSDVRAAMDRWQEASAHVVSFVEAPDASAKVTFRACGQAGPAVGYDACVDGCEVALCPGSYHFSLGRVIGLWPEQRRFDRDHYVRVRGACDSPALVDRCGSAENASDFGPFDYGTSMFSFTDEALISRWNGQPLSDPIVRDAPPSDRDGAAVIERYQLATGWTKFRRMLDQTPPSPYEPLALTPFTDDVSRAIPIAANANPALETWLGEAMAMYIRGTGDTILKEWWDAQRGSWFTSPSLLGVPGLGDLSDPAIASWGAFRNDTVVRRGTTVYITSDQTQMPWESLGAPTAMAASSPAITTWGENRLDVVVRAQDDRLYHKSCSASCSGNSGTWSEWLPIEGATVRGKPAIVSRGPGHLDVFAHGMDGRIWTSSWADDRWGSWSALPVTIPLYWDPNCPDCSSPSAGTRSSSSLDVYVRGADNRLWSASWSETAGWAEFVSRGGDLASSPATGSTARDLGQVDVIVIMTEDHGGSEPYRAPWWKSYRSAP